MTRADALRAIEAACAVLAKFHTHATVDEVAVIRAALVELAIDGLRGPMVRVTAHDGRDVFVRPCDVLVIADMIPEERHGGPTARATVVHPSGFQYTTDVNGSAESVARALGLCTEGGSS